jgi:hypothetical protein
MDLTGTLGDHDTLSLMDLHRDASTLYIEIGIAGHVTLGSKAVSIAFWVNSFGTSFH